MSADNRTRRFVARIDDLGSPDVQALIHEHLQGMQTNSPPGHVHALALDALRQPDVTFWSIWDGTTLCGCAALKELDPFEPAHQLYLKNGFTWCGAFGDYQATHFNAFMAGNLAG